MFEQTTFGNHRLDTSRLSARVCDGMPGYHVGMGIDWNDLDNAIEELGGGRVDGRSALAKLGDAWGIPERTLLGWTRPRTLDVDGLQRTVHGTAEELLGVFLPILRILHTHPRPASQRLLAAIGGIPGSGKTTVTGVIERLWQDLALEPALRGLAMDGYHLPNETLDRKTIRQPDGRVISLRQRKGCPESFDIEAMRFDLQQLRTAETVRMLPRYDRALHEPMPEAVPVTAADGILLFEGNYLLDDEGAFRSISPLFDVRIFLDADPSAARQAVVARHQRGGCSPDEARRKFERNDALNTRIAEKTCRNAHYRIKSDESFLRTGLVVCELPGR